MEVTRCTGGLNHVGRACVQSASPRLADCKLTRMSASSFCTWCCWQCSVLQGATSTIINISTPLRPTGKTIRRSNFYWLHGYHFILLNWTTSRVGAAATTRNWRISFGPLEPMVVIPAAPMPWTLWTDMPYLRLSPVNEHNDGQRGNPSRTTTGVHHSHVTVCRLLARMNA